MPGASWWNRSLYPVLLLLVFLSSAVSAYAQSPARDSDDGEESKPAPTLSLNIALSEEGTAQVNFVSYGQLSTSSDIKTAIESSLGCTLEDRRPPRNFVPQFYSGSCEPAFRRTSMLREIKIPTAPLWDFAQAHQIERISLAVHLPDVEVTETEPPAQAPDFPFGKTPEKFKRLQERNRSYSWRTDSAIPDFIAVRFGLSTKSVARAAYLLPGILVLPALLIFWMGRKALSSQAQDKAAVWFTYMRYLQWTLNLSLLGWWLAADSLHLIPILQFLSEGTRVAFVWSYPVASTIVLWLPPAFIWVACFALSHPVQEKLRGLTWTRRELAMQGVFAFCASLLPLALVLTGFTTMVGSSVQIGMLWIVAAFTVAIVASRSRQKFLGMQPQALTTGDLRDRAFAMAQQLGVKLQQVYVIPSGKGQMANAFARRGNVISFTDFLLQRMTRREVNYVLGHEMSHLKLGHPGKLAIAAVVSYFLAFTSLSFAEPFVHLPAAPRYALIVAIVILVPYFCSRRFEYAADAGAVELTHDPEAAISALFKIAQLNMLPIHWSNWSEKWLTHPSSLRRAHAIARKAGIPPERVPEIAQTAAAADDHYVLPETATLGAKVHSTQRKQGGSLRVSLIMLAVIIFTPAAFALLSHRFFAANPLRGLIYLAGFAATIAMYYAFANFVPPRGIRTTVPALAAKFAKEGVLAETWDGIFVGFSPAAAPRNYELNSYWDLGCLFLRSDRLCYWGEETKFLLRPNQITAITLAPGMPGLLAPLRIYFAWKDEELGASGVFNIGCIDGASTLRLRQQNAALAQRLKTWWKTAATASQMPGPLASLHSPQIGAVTGVPPGNSATPAKVFKELLWTGIFAMVGAVLCGLPFQLMSFLFGSINESFGRITAFHSPGAGYYVLAVALVVRFIALIPILRYKDQAMVTLAPSRPLAAQVSAAQDTPAQPAKIESDTVLSN